MSMIKNIIFDFGGVLYKIRYQNIAEAFAKCGVHNFEEIYSKQKQSDTMDRFEEGFISVDEFHAYVRSLSNVALTDRQIDDCWNAILIGFPEEHERLLRRVGKHYSLYLYSNTNQPNYEVFTKQIREQFGYDLFAERFKKAYFSQLLHIRKPKVDGFIHIIQENNLVPEETLFIDDSPQHLVGARAAGLQSLHLADGMSLEELFDDEGFLLSE